MTLRLRVGPDWPDDVRAVAGRYEPLVPVVKGNGYGFGRATLARLAAELLAERASDFPATLAVGTASELGDLPDALRVLVLTPVSRYDVGCLERHRRPLATVASAADVRVLEGWHGEVVVKLASSMHRFGATRDDLAGLVSRARAAGLDVVGYAIHLPLAGRDEERAAEIRDWLPALDASIGELWVSHLAPDAYESLRRTHPGWRFPMRLGSTMWHGDKSSLHLGADVVARRRLPAGTVAGYSAVPLPTDGAVVVVGAGTAHGVGLLEDGRSPFHFRRRRLALLERPHMHVSMLFVPADEPVPEVGQIIDVQRPLISVSVDAVIWS